MAQVILIVWMLFGLREPDASRWIHVPSIVRDNVTVGQWKHLLGANGHFTEFGNTRFAIQTMSVQWNSKIAIELFCTFDGDDEMRVSKIKIRNKVSTDTFFPYPPTKKNGKEGRTQPSSSRLSNSPVRLPAGPSDLPPFYVPVAVRVDTLGTLMTSAFCIAAEACQGQDCTNTNSAGVRYPNELRGRTWL
jgi:hypothetical protein